MYKELVEEAISHLQLISYSTVPALKEATPLPPGRKRKPTILSKPHPATLKLFAPTMAILSFIKSSSSKNKVAVISLSDASAHRSPKAPTPNNLAKKDAPKTKTISEFKVSAMAYAVSRA